MDDKDKCGLCGSLRVTDFGYKRFEATVICNACGAHWWKRWHTKAEWEAYVNEESLVGLDKGMKL